MLFAEEARPATCYNLANLTPMCDPCQRPEKQKTGDAMSLRFSSSNFETSSLPQIVQLEIAPPFKTPTFSLAPHPDLTGADWMLVVTHIRVLQALS